MEAMDADGERAAAAPPLKMSCLRVSIGLSRQIMCEAVFTAALGPDSDVNDAISGFFIARLTTIAAIACLVAAWDIP